MKTRSYRLIHGVCYPHLIANDNPTSIIQTQSRNREQLYYDPAIRLSEGDLQRFGSIAGKPIRLNHDENIEIGFIKKAWKDREGKLRINAAIYDDNDFQRSIFAKIEKGLLSGLSVGYDNHVSKNGEIAHVTHKTFNEISVCEQGKKPQKFFYQFVD